MRYASRHANLALYTKNGKSKYRFTQGVLELGSGKTIDTTDLQEVFPDLTGDAKYGLGVLFVEAPILETDSDQITDNRWYEVVQGEVTYRGKKYVASQKVFVEDKTKLSGTGKIALTFGTNDYNDMRKEAFKLQHLLVGDEVTGYHSWDKGGYEPRNTLDENGVGYVRKS